MSNSPKATRPFKSDARVAFRDGYRPVASTLPTFMTVFISTARVTTVLVEGKPVMLSTRALVAVR